MNDDEIITCANLCIPETEVRLRMRNMLDLARADERKKIEAEVHEAFRTQERCGDVGVPPVGSGPWAIMQHKAGKRLQYSVGYTSFHWIGKHNDDERVLPMGAITADSGWSVVEEPAIDTTTPMTFAEMAVWVLEQDGWAKQEAWHCSSKVCHGTEYGRVGALVWQHNGELYPVTYKCLSATWYRVAKGKP